MASSFDRWEKDPFFSAAEEVQESADRMESAYRTWVHAEKDGASGMWNCEELRRDLRTAVGTTKWQLEEFQRAVGSSYIKSSSEDARGRHREFVLAIEDHVSRIENSIQESAGSGGKTSLPWLRLDEGESNEFALFLSAPSTSGINTIEKYHKLDTENPQEMGKGLGPDCPKNSALSTEGGSLEPREEKFHGHRRTVSAADIDAWKIVISEDSCLPNSPNAQTFQPPRKIPSMSGILGSIESTYKIKWPKNGVRKWKAADCQQESDTAPLRSLQLSRGINECYERSKSCLDSGDDCYDKQLYGWYGAIQRQLQRSQYQMQYSRPFQRAISVVLLLCLIVLIALRAL